MKEIDARQKNTIAKLRIHNYGYAGTRVWTEKKPYRSRLGLVRSSTSKYSTHNAYSVGAGAASQAT